MTTYGSYRAPAPKPTFSLPSILAIAAAIGSFFVGAGWGVFLAIIAIIFGLIGFLLAFSSRIRGGMTSAISIVVGLIGIIVAIVKLLT